MPRRPDAHRLEGAAYRAIASLLALALGIAYVNHKSPYTWAEHFDAVRAKREDRHKYLDFSQKVVDFCRGNIPPGKTVLIGEYQGMRRMTLTYPELDRVRSLLWIITGEEKVDALRKLLARDPSIPAGRVEPGGDSLILADRAAAPEA